MIANAEMFPYETADYYLSKRHWFQVMIIRINIVNNKEMRFAFLLSHGKENRVVRLDILKTFPHG